MKMTVVGYSPAVPNPGAACSGYVVEHGETKVLVDCGHGVVGILQRLFGIEELSGLLISHMHPDHIFDLVPLKYAYFFGDMPPVPLLLPPGGIAQLRSLQAALGLAADFFERSFRVEEYDPDRSITTFQGLSIDLHPTQHYIPAYAMRYNAASGEAPAIFYSSDTGYIESLSAFARGAEVGIVEATLLEPDMRDEKPGHLTGTEAGKLAAAAGLQRLVLTHYWWELGPRLQKQAVDVFHGSVELAETGQYHEVTAERHTS